MWYIQESVEEYTGIQDIQGLRIYKSSGYTRVQNIQGFKVSSLKIPNVRLIMREVPSSVWYNHEITKCRKPYKVKGINLFTIRNLTLFSSLLCSYNHQDHDQSNKSSSSLVFVVCAVSEQGMFFLKQAN